MQEGGPECMELGECVHVGPPMQPILVRLQDFEESSLDRNGDCLWPRSLSEGTALPALTLLGRLN